MTVRNHSTRALAVSALALSLLAGCTDSSGPNSAEHGVLSFVDVNSPIDLTPDGGIALLEDLNVVEGKVYFYNTATGVLTHQTDVGDPGRDIVTGISADGRVSALYADPVEAGLWSAGSGWVSLAHQYAVGCGMDYAGAWDISADGHVAVGLGWDGCHAAGFRWSDASGTGVFSQLDLLGTAAEGDTTPPTNRVSVISDDGSMMAGFAQDGFVDRRPAIWRADGSGFLLNPTVPDAPGEVLSISADGHLVAGIWNQNAFYWTQETNVVDIGTLPGALVGTPTFPNAIAANGKLIFGTCGDGFSGDQAAFVWTQAGGMRRLQDILARNFITVPAGVTLTGIYAASADGRVVLGTAIKDQFVQTTFVLKAPVSLYGI